MVTRILPSLRMREEVATLIEGRLSTASAKDEIVTRLFMSSKKAVTVSACSLEPAIMCTSTRRPSTVKPQAAKTRSRTQQPLGYVERIQSVEDSREGNGGS